MPLVLVVVAVFTAHAGSGREEAVVPETPRSHWAYQPVRRLPAPAVRDGAWPRNAIDHFVLRRLEADGFEASGEADRSTLFRRLCCDLLGVLPGTDQLDDFLADTDPGAYDRLVDRLLASVHVGERWGRHWLDSARYADSDGYEKDRTRPNAWRYRDWVIDAHNADLAFDRFTVQQIAGDLLPEASVLDRLATAFHRQTLTNTEGGTDQEEFRVEAVVDRTSTTGTVWLGLTVGCARCHDHKYDRLGQEEFYRLFAFFNSGDDVTTEVPISVEESELHALRQAEHEKRLAPVEAERRVLEAEIAGGLSAWERDIGARLQAAGSGVGETEFQPLEIIAVKSTGDAGFERLEDGSWIARNKSAKRETYTIEARSQLQRITGFRIEALLDPSLPGKGPGRADNGNFVISEFRVHAAARPEDVAASPVELAGSRADFSQKDFPVDRATDGDSRTGWAVGPATGKPHHADFGMAVPLEGAGDSMHLRLVIDQQHGDEHTVGRFRIFAMTGTDVALEVPGDVRRILSVAAAKRSAGDARTILDHFLRLDSRVRDVDRRRARLVSLAPKRPVMMVRVVAARQKPRETRVFERGDFQRPTEVVQPGIPATLHPLLPRGQRPDRLDLARWLVDPANPLTPRVVANQVWSHLFGQGLVTTPGDFGVRGDRPSHPELLDWLASELVRRRWSLKEFIRVIVTSATYRQSSRHRPDLAGVDPRNRLLAHQSRFRVDAEVVRDLHLSVSGLLDLRVGGPSVFPPMPPEIASLSYANNFSWKTSPGGDRYRRGLYTFFKRTAPHPNLITFDCPDANTTCVGRRTSNTPLQALTLLNNEVFVESARALARRVLLEIDGDPRVRLGHAFRLCLARLPTAFEEERFLGLHAQSRRWYAGNPEAATAVCGAATAAATTAKAPTETAAWITTLRILFNTDEFITRE